MLVEMNELRADLTARLSTRVARDSYGAGKLGKVKELEQAFSRLAKTVLTLFSTRVKMLAYANPFIELAPE